jgi:hypothetical protein
VEAMGTKTSDRQIMIKRHLSHAFNEEQSSVLAEVIQDAYADLAKTSDFNELKAIVLDLASAQKQTSTSLNDLASAQQRTEIKVEELASAQQRTEIKVEELAASQNRTEIKVEELASAQQRTEKSLEKLAKAQDKTDRSLQKLTRQVGGLSDAIGGDMEDIAVIAIHTALQRRFNWKIKLEARQWLKLPGHRKVEVDVLGTAFDPATPDSIVRIIGETKHNLTRRQVARFAGLIDRVRSSLAGDIFPVFCCYRCHPDVRQIVNETGFHLVHPNGELDAELERFIDERGGENDP